MDRKTHSREISTPAAKRSMRSRGLSATVCVAAGLIGLYVALPWVPEPYRAKIWTLAPTAFVVVALLAGALVGIDVVRKRGVGALAAVAAVLALVCAVVGLFGSELLRYPSRIATEGPGIAVRLPLDGPLQVAWGGDQLRENYHAAYADQRWAYDLVVKPSSHGSTAVADYGCFGKPVVSPIAGEVRSAHDGAADQVPGEDDVPDGSVFGNYVVIRPEGTELRLVIAHLREGSIVVEEGQSVAEGEVIGECGNSGSSTEPHVHIHVVRIYELWGETILVGAPLFFRDHEGPRMPSGGLATIEGREILTGDQVRHTGR